MDTLLCQSINDYIPFAACCISQEALKRNSFAKAFTDFSDEDGRMRAAILLPFLETLFAREFTQGEVEALARRVGSYTIYASLSRKNGQRLEHTLSFEECEYIFEVCRGRGYSLQ